MKLQAVFSRDEVVAFASEFLPLKLQLGDPKKDERYLLLSDPKTIDLVPGRGLRIACRAQIRWPVLGMNVPITARNLSVLMTPSVVELDGQPALAFKPRIEQADLSGVPARLDSTLTEAVNRALMERVAPTWKFGTMLTRSIAMPAMLSTTQSIDLGVAAGEVHVSEEAFTFSLVVRATAPRRSE
ncbi:MAG TPA: hypothetical protein VFX59_06010 [Polyangiales bacterium]|nr:hypothetical protein [Polyangiales bacterium]